MSTRLPSPDVGGNRLREEIHQLGDDVRAGKVFVEPSPIRDDDDFDRLALGLNHLQSLEEYKQLKQRNSAQ